MAGSERFELRKIILEEQGKMKLMASGLSMFPTLRPKDELIIAHFPFEKIKSGDIVAFKRANRWVLHRVVKINEAGYITKGDSRMAHDELITKENYVGKLVLRNRKSKKKSYETTLSKFRLFLITNKLSTLIFWTSKWLIRFGNKLKRISSAKSKKHD